MTRGLLYWILMLLWLLFGAWGYFGTAPSWHPIGNYLLLFLLFVLIGWDLYGAPIRGGPARTA